jgi:hypothetical protein
MVNGAAKTLSSPRRRQLSDTLADVVKAGEDEVERRISFVAVSSSIFARPVEPLGRSSWKAR